MRRYALLRALLALALACIATVLLAWGLWELSPRLLFGVVFLALAVAALGVEVSE